MYALQVLLSLCYDAQRQAMATTVTKTKETSAPVRLGYPSLRRAAAILGVDPSTLSRRQPPFEPVGSEKRIPAWAVMDQAAHFNKRYLNEVAFDLVAVAEEQSPDAVEAIEEEITDWLKSREEPGASPAWLEEAQRYLPAALYMQVQEAYEAAQAGASAGLSGPPPR